MSAPKTLRGFDKLFVTEVRAAREALSEILDHPAQTRDEHIARYREMLDAETTLADLFDRAMAVMPLPASGRAADSILFHALSVARARYSSDALVTRRSLDELLAEGGAG
jgi:hypothetical protein